jgi:AcrR family transcriptional regulator
MPKVVDHETRRRELADALLRVVVRDGFDAVSIRSVADEAGCSIRPLQYYFDDKAQLLAVAHARVSERMAALVTDAVRTLGDKPHPRTVVRALVHAFLPTTEEARDAVVAYHCFFAAELTHPELRISNGAAPPNALVRVVRDQVERHHDRPASVTELRDIQLLVTSLSTIAAGVTAGYFRLAEAQELLDHQIERLLPASRGAPR